MSKIFLLFTLFLNFNAAAYAVNGPCSHLLSDQNADSGLQLRTYLKELFEQGLVSESDLIEFRDSLLRGDRINPIKDHELDINRYIAFEKISELLKKYLDIEKIHDFLNQIISRSQISFDVQNIVKKEISGLAFFAKTATQDELMDLISNYFSTAESVKDYIALREAILRSEPKQCFWYGVYVFSQPHWSSHPELLRLAIEKTLAKDVHRYARHVFSEEHWSSYPELLRMVIEKNPPNTIEGVYFTFIFSREYWSGHPELLRFVLEKSPIENFSRLAQNLITNIFEKEFWSVHPDLFRFALERTSPQSVYQYSNFLYLSKNYFINQKHFLQSLEFQDSTARTIFLRNKIGSYSWEGTEQENLEEYLNKLYGRLDE